jgi:hypothetical protein
MELVQFPFCDARNALMFPAKFTAEKLSVSLSRNDRITNPRYYRVTLNAMQDM